jgi:outer membrane protein assembly factor BamB
MNTTDPFTTYHRMTFERYGTVFELEISPQRVSMWYDMAKVSDAAKALAGQIDQSVVARIVAEYPGTTAAQAALDRMIDQASNLKGAERRIVLWHLNDVGAVNGLKVSDEIQAECNIKVAQPQPAPLAATYEEKSTALPHDANTLLVVLKPAPTPTRSASEGRSASDPKLPTSNSLALLGMRSKRSNANKFGVICWDLAANKAKWEASEIRLKDKGEEEGFLTYFIHDGKVIVHGWYDVLALSMADGSLVWRTQVPHGFRIQNSAAAEDVLVLADNTRTLALHLRGGQVIWESNESGGLYSPPILRDNVLVTVRRNPSGVSFRNLGTGRLLSHLSLPTLTQRPDNPAVTWDEPSVPMAENGRTLFLTDGWDYIAVDLAERRVRWQRRIAGLDHGEERVGAFRFWMNDSAVVVLKPEYDNVALEAFAVDDGRQLWHIGESKTPGVLHSVALGPQSLFGLHYSQDDATAVNVLGYNLETGQRLYREVSREWTRPQTWLDGPLHGNHFIVRISDEQNRVLKVVNAATGKPQHQIKVTGFGQWGQYGQISHAVVGSYLVVLSDKTLIVGAPK